ncbi:Mn-containing catalase [Chryseobacterium sp. SORGH_AS 447]|uniref:manganese catalase family protein n=1 Tax=Chryseobacterium sp. SORGH_AS_0447 TaxID=3041769 RepID=UPI002788684C|nr:manganese catalase family protein [Chryseobacterium sp. SORGH_AS_0447]MDQ1163239.1 Mn-containing catalase [Chryseobacterium sp. SORGH_AS_0447]
MFYHSQKLINPIVPDEPDPSAANALQEGLGGQFGEMRTMMQFLFQSFNFRGNATPYMDLIQGVGIEEISHVELITKTISQLLDGSPRYQGDQYEAPGKNGDAALDMAKEQQNPHHYIIGAQSALPVDAAGNPWSGSYVHNHGNLVLDLMDNLVLEATGRLQKCRIYEMSTNKTLRATVAFLIVRDEAHQAAFAKALEKLGVDWGKVLPVPKFDSSQFPEVKRLLDLGLHREQYTFRLDGSMMEQIFSGPSPFNDGTQLTTLTEPRESFLVPQMPERPEEFAPGLDAELQALADAFTEFKESGGKIDQNIGINGNKEE